MNWETVKILLIHELRILFRDRRTVILSIVLPLIILPLTIYVAKYNNDKREKALGSAVFRYVLTGSNTEFTRELIQRAFVKVTRSKELSKFRLQEMVAGNPEESLKKGEIDFYIQTKSGEEADREELEIVNGSQSVKRDKKRLKGVAVIKFYYQADRESSEAGMQRMEALLLRAQMDNREVMLRRRGLPISVKEIFNIENESLATAGQVTGSQIGKFATLMLIILMLTGGSVAAIDIISGEKERGTLETLLATAPDRREIVAAKQIAIIVVILLTILIQLVNALFYITLGVVKLPPNFVLQISAETLLALLLLFIPLAGLVASILLMISGYAKSYKEAQLYFFPVYLLSLLPASASLLPGVSLRSAIFLVPIANVSVAVREVLVGKHDWLMIMLTFIVMTIYAVIAIRSSAKTLSEERLITQNETTIDEAQDGQARFSRHVLQWYLVMWALLFAAGSNLEVLATLQRQLLFNQLFIFLAVPIFIIWRYRLDPKQALSLKSVNLSTWVAVILVVPAGQLLGVGVFRLANLVFPVPPQALEQFGSQIMVNEIPRWQLYLLIALLPAVCEEIAFRGLLLYGLRKRFKPIVLVLVVGLVFGLFHFQLFRIIPTGFLGVVLSGILVMTGSIFPGMVAHAGNNALTILLAENGFALHKLDVWVYFAAGLVFSLCMYIIYRNRISGD